MTSPPAIGDWIFFSEGANTYKHVGLVVDVDGNNVTTVEGNLDDTITSRGPIDYRGPFGTMTVFGYGTPSWGVG